MAAVGMTMMAAVGMTKMSMRDGVKPVVVINFVQELRGGGVEGKEGVRSDDDAAKMPSF